LQAASAKLERRKNSGRKPFWAKRKARKKNAEDRTASEAKGHNASGFLPSGQTRRAKGPFTKALQPLRLMPGLTKNPCRFKQTLSPPVFISLDTRVT
jgi:hypothetical protein